MCRSKLTSRCLDIRVCDQLSWSASFEANPKCSGGFIFGGSAAPQYNLSFIVENSVKIGKPIIGVSINYRVSAWGWMFSNETLVAGVTNLGARDARLALQWLQENVVAFGGDPTKVTVWGESAGAGIATLQTTAFG